jgi:hypothetical protein
MVGEHEYNEEQLYKCDEIPFYYGILPIRLMDFKVSK